MPGKSRMPCSDRSEILHPEEGPSVRQIYACKSIDRLITDSEAPSRQLRKTLGRWSLVGLGVGAIIGSGIFVLTGTAAAGENFEAPSILHAQVLDLIVNFVRHGSMAGVLLHGRPAAGPAIAISFILVAVACSFAGLCYAELASMIPVAGSAYTYSYATLGEIFAWIIGWDLILEYAVSNVAVAVSFSGYLKAQLSTFGIALPGRWSGPVWAEGHLTGAYFNLPAFLVVFVLTVLLVRGIRESTRANNLMVTIKLLAIVTFLVVGGMLVHPANWHPFAPAGFSGIVTGGAIIFFTYIGFDSVSTAAEESKNPQKDIPFGIITSLAVCAVLYVRVCPDFPVAHRDRRHDRNAVLAPGFSIRTNADLVRDVARPSHAGALLRGAPALSDSALVDLDCRRGGRDPGRTGRYRRRRRPLQHRHAFRLCPRFGRRPGAAAPPTGTPPRIPGPARPALSLDFNRAVRRAHDRADGDDLDPVRFMDGRRAGDLPLLQSLAKRICPSCGRLKPRNGGR